MIALLLTDVKEVATTGQHAGKNNLTKFAIDSMMYLIEKTKEDSMKQHYFRIINFVLCLALLINFGPGVTAVATQEDGQGVTRLAGENRLITSYLVADMLKEQMGVEKFNAVIVASGGTFADALPGSYLSAVKNAPILLTLAKDKFIQQTADYIKENLAAGGTVYILGGESAVPATMEKALAGFNVQRVAGADRFGTNLEILKTAGVKAGDEVLVCEAKGYADSLSASATGKPVLLVYKKLTDAQKAYLATLSGCSFTVVGGTTAVPEKLAQEIEAYGTVTRLAGKDRLETSTMVAEKYFGSATTAVVAYGWDFPDGLCGGSLAYAMKAPLILTHSKEKLSDFTAEYTTKAGITGGIVLGGDGLVNDMATRGIFAMEEASSIIVIDKVAEETDKPVENHIITKVALITDFGTIDDESFNQACWEGVKEWCTANSLPYTYYQPGEYSTEAHVKSIVQAISEGCNAIVLPGYLFGAALSNVMVEYPDIYFMGIDIAEGDLTVDYSTFYKPSANTACITFAEEQAGFLAGYAAVKDGYTKLGFLGGMAVPAVVRYGYGFIQGADTAAQELGVEIEINYTYGGIFFATADITAKMDSWYQAGTEVVFACGGGIYLSALEAAEKNNGKVIGVDIDQAHVSDLIITSAVKKLKNATMAVLDALNKGEFATYGGKTSNLSLADGEFVGLPTEKESWRFNNFTVEAYEAAKDAIASGRISVSNDTSVMPNVSGNTTVNQLA